MDDFKKLLYGVLISFALLIVGFVSFTFIWSCGLDFSCKQAAPPPAGTPVPTLIPATLPAPKTDGVPDAFGKCEVKALDLLGAWVEAGSPESDAFPFADTNGNLCEGSFAGDIQPLFSESQLWFPASLSCTSCHNDALAERSAGLDLASYAGILAGSRRASADAKGTDILGGDWTNSLLYLTLTQADSIVDGHPPQTYPAADLVIYAGAHVPPPTPTMAPIPTEAPSTTATQ
jgi:hypothetical protein